MLRSLLQNHKNDGRVRSFLLNEQAKRERVGKNVSLIVDGLGDLEKFGTAELRLQLLRPGGNPYITVRARLFKELASRGGATSEFFDLCESEIRKLGYWSSGTAAIEVLGLTFAGDDKARTLLMEFLSASPETSQGGPIVSALLVGFDSADVRQVIEREILNHAGAEHRRASMLSVCPKTS